MRKLQEKVKGQDQAVLKLASILDELAKDNKHQDNARFLFVGPSGVGKTKLAEAVKTVENKSYFGTIRLGNFADESHYLNFTGVGIGYKGGGDKPFFAKELDKAQPKAISPNCFEISDAVFLSDELKKPI